MKENHYEKLVKILVIVCATVILFGVPAVYPHAIGENASGAFLLYLFIIGTVLFSKRISFVRGDNLKEMFEDEQWIINYVNWGICLIIELAFMIV